MKALFIFMAVCFMAMPLWAQLDCDINGDGIGGSAADIIYLINIYHMPPEDFCACDIPCDLDDDGLAMTIADITSLFFLLGNPGSEPPQLTYRPDQDTVMIESTETSPGSQVYLSVWLNTVDSLISYEFLLKADPEILTIEAFDPDSDLEFEYSFSASLLHIYDMGAAFINDSAFIPPGNYHLGDIVIQVNPDIGEPVTTHITFGTCPDDNFYTGLANMTFFVPVLVDGVITITPVSVDDESADLPIATSTIEAYPNPFNSSVNIIVESPIQDVLSIYDVLGREIYRYEIAAGRNSINWNSIDSDNYPVNAGVYFAKLRNSSQEARKLLLVK